jgi:hypothetical protein
MRCISRRDLLRGAGALSASALAVEGAPMLRVAENTARDRMSLFVHSAGVCDGYLELGGVRGGSRMTAAEGAYYLGVPNVVLVRVDNLPPTPNLESWKARTRFEQFAISFRPLKRVIWSVVGSAGRADGNESSLVLKLARDYPNIRGVYMDDFLRNQGKVRRGVMTPEQLRALRGRLTVGGRRLETWLTLYTHQVDPNAPNFLPTDVPLREYLDPFDIVLLWTSSSDDLTRLEQNFAKLTAIRPRGNGLGLYLWDFRNARPVPVPLMERQCQLALQWLKQGRIREMVFLTNAVLDVGLEVVEWTRNWIESVAGEPVAPP